MNTQPEALRLVEVSPYLEHSERGAWITDVKAELRRQHALLQEWEEKAATWLASPEAAQRLEGYRDLAQRLERAEAQRDALLGLLKEARKIAPASSSRNLAKDWDQRTTAAIRAVEGELK